VKRDSLPDGSQPANPLGPRPCWIPFGIRP